MRYVHDLGQMASWHLTVGIFQPNYCGFLGSLLPVTVKVRGSILVSPCHYNGFGAGAPVRQKTQKSNHTAPNKISPAMLHVRRKMQAEPFISLLLTGIVVVCCW